jgi:hypothetical protein
MKLATTTRALLLACIATAPLLGGADGGCSNDDPVSIGGDERDAGTGGGGHDPSGEPCGPTHCSAGLECCNESCGICAAPGEGCIAVGCVDPCGAQPAAGVGACDLHLGYRWNGSTCESLGGCSCEGPACIGLFASMEECQARHSNCNSGGECRAQDQAIIDYLSAFTACNDDHDCRTVSIDCSELASDCSGTFYTNVEVEDGAIAPLQRALRACVTGDQATGCGVCALGVPPAGCFNGTCGPGPFGRCQAEEQAFVDYLRSNRSCTVDSDCKIVDACETAAARDCSGSFYGNTDIDDTTLAELRGAFDECRGSDTCLKCALQSAPAACVNGACGPKPFDSCASQATSCEAGCFPMQARPYDAAAGCLSAPTTVGCTADTVGTDDIVCLRRASDGALFFGSSSSMFLKEGSGWASCTQAEEAAVGGAPSCE